MRHTPAEIVDLARGVGFHYRLLAPVTAIALCASGGHDHYDLRAGMPGAGHWQGLWAIDADRWTDLAGHDLHDPYVAAQAAKYLTHTLRSLDWSPAFASGALRHYRDAATSAVGARPAPPAEYAPRAGHVVEQAGIVHELLRKVS